MYELHEDPSVETRRKNKKERRVWNMRFVYTTGFGAVSFCFGGRRVVVGLGGIKGLGGTVGLFLGLVSLPFAIRIAFMDNVKFCCSFFSSFSSHNWLSESNLSSSFVTFGGSMQVDNYSKQFMNTNTQKKKKKHTKQTST